MKTEETTTAEASPTVFDTKVFTDGLKAQIKAAGGTAAFYRQNDIIKQLTKATFQVMLDAEMEEHLGYGSNDREAKVASVYPRQVWCGWRYESTRGVTGAVL